MLAILLLDRIACLARMSSSRPRLEVRLWAGGHGLDKGQRTARLGVQHQGNDPLRELRLTTQPTCKRPADARWGLFAIAKAGGRSIYARVLRSSHRPRLTILMLWAARVTWASIWVRAAKDSHSRAKASAFAMLTCAKLASV